MIYYMYDRECGRSFGPPVEINDEDLLDKSAALVACYSDAVVYNPIWYDGPEPAPNAAFTGLLRAWFFALFCLCGFYTVTIAMACYAHHTRPDWHFWAWAAGAVGAAVGVVRSK